MGREYAVKQQELAIVEKEDVLFYAVRSQDNQYFRRKGFGAYGESWTDDLKAARIYTQIGHARAIVTWFAKNHPSYGIARLVVFRATEIEVVEETKRVLGVQDKEKQAALNREERAAMKDAAEAAERVEAVRRKKAAK